MAGKTLVGVDGSTLSFTYTEAGLTRRIVSPGGAEQTTGFSFINDKLGTLSDTDTSSDVIGFFRRMPSGLDVTYADGRRETIAPAPGGGVTMTLHAPDNGSYCMGWYPQGHVFSESERRAALTLYARKLGLEAPRAGAALSSCGAGETRKSADAAPILVRTSGVHAIDADVKARLSETANETPRNGDSRCLSVDSDGAHWGFRNHCGYGVKFSYCLENASADGASCNQGPQSGRVAAEGFAPLLTQSAMGDVDAEHNFRWVACGEKSGTVEAKLDQVSPPSGRCIRASAS